MRSLVVEGLVIKRENIGEADKIITLLTKEQGKIAVYAKGIRKVNSKRLGVLELFNHVSADILTKDNQKKIITEAQIINAFDNWKKQLGRTSVAYQLAEAVDKILPEDEPQPRVFQLLKQWYSSIPDLGNDWEATVQDWLQTLIFELGYIPEDYKIQGDIFEYISSLVNRKMYTPTIFKKVKKYGQSA